MKKREPVFKTEADLCAAFIAWTKRWGWTAYAETAGWDIVLVRSSGVQIGVQAKLAFNTKVLAQSLPHYARDAEIGPDYRVVLVDRTTDGAREVCEALGLVLFHAEHYRSFREPRIGFSPSNEPELNHHEFSRYGNAWYDWNPRQRIKLPDYVPDVAAGASGPVQLTPWKIGALKLIATMDLRGYVTRDDFRMHSINPSRWMQRTGQFAWLVDGGVPGQWKRGPALDFDRQHPTVYAQIRNEIAQRIPEQGKAA